MCWSSAVMSQEASCIEGWALPNGTQLRIRHFKPSDSEIEQTFVRGLSDWSRYQRFHGTIRELSRDQLKALTAPSPHYETALIVVHDKAGAEEEIGVARYLKYTDRTSCEF